MVATAGLWLTADGVSQAMEGWCRPAQCVQLAPLPGASVIAQLRFPGTDCSCQAAGEDGRFVFLLCGALVVPERAVFAAEQMIGLGRVGQACVADQGLPGR
ncbi:hypothetical protein D3C79_914470 [compost metagenome]